MTQTQELCKLFNNHMVFVKRYLVKSEVKGFRSNRTIGF